MTPLPTPRYLAELQAAIDFTRGLGFTRQAGFRPGPRLLGAGFCSIIREWARLNICSRSDHEIAGRCLRIAADLSAFLSGAGVANLYTLGAMSYGDEWIFRFDSEDVRRWLQDGLPDRQRLEMHAWITLGSGEILDPSWLTSLGIMRNQRHLIGAVIAADPEDGAFHRYHPVAVDFGLLPALGLTDATTTVPADLACATVV